MELNNYLYIIALAFQLAAGLILVDTALNIKIDLTVPMQSEDGQGIEIPAEVAFKKLLGKYKSVFSGIYLSIGFILMFFAAPYQASKSYQFLGFVLATIILIILADTVSHYIANKNKEKRRKIPNENVPIGTPVFKEVDENK